MDLQTTFFGSTILSNFSELRVERMPQIIHIFLGNSCFPETPVTNKRKVKLRLVGKLVGIELFSTIRTRIC